MFDSRNGDNDGTGLATAVALEEEENHRLFTEKQQISVDEDGQKCLYLCGGRSFFHGKWLVTKPRVLGIVDNQPTVHLKNDVRSKT